MLGRERKRFTGKRKRRNGMGGVVEGGSESWNEKKGRLEKEGERGVMYVVSSQTEVKKVKEKIDY